MEPSNLPLFPAETLEAIELGHLRKILVQPNLIRLPYIIGEFGSCHEEGLGRCFQGIEVARQAGCDAVKFQYWSSPARMRDRRQIAYPAYEVGSIKAEWFPQLRKKCREVNISLACSVYLPEDVAMVSEWVDVFKVSSFEARDRALQVEVLRWQQGRPFFLSTGMQGAEHDKDLPKTAIYLHCISAYPCPPAEANLGAIEPHEGYSDHTRMVLTGALAVAAGADYLEVHYRLDTTAPQVPDYVVSLTPQELTRYVYWARTAHVMRGTGIKEPQPSEEGSMKHRVIA